MTGFNIPGIGGASPTTAGSSGSGAGGTASLTNNSVSVGVSETSTKLQVAIDNGIWQIDAYLVASQAMNIDYSFNDDLAPDDTIIATAPNSFVTGTRRIITSTELSGTNAFRRLSGIISMTRTPVGTLFVFVGEFIGNNVISFYYSYFNQTENAASFELIPDVGNFVQGSKLTAIKLADA